MLPLAFELYSTVHTAALLGSFVLIVAAVTVGRIAAARSARAERRFRLGWVAWVAVTQTAFQVWSQLPGRFDPALSLPLHICDIVPWIGIVALLTENRRARAILYFWAFGLSIFAFLRPALRLGPAHPEFWVFWTAHAQILATAAYAVAVLGYRPDGAGFRTAAVALLLYSVAVLPIALWLGADYGYVGPSPLTAPLGPWPQRLVPIFFGELAIFGLLLLPFRRRGGAATAG